MKQHDAQYDIAIIGAGVTGSALYYVLNKYTDVNRIAVIEKYSLAGQVNSKSTANSHTLHFGDIETNYSIEKAEKVKHAAHMVERYVRQAGRHELHERYSKMVLGVGEQQIRQLKQRHENMKQLFPELEYMHWKDIATIEPAVADDREDIAALYSPNGYAIDFGRLSESFLEVATTKDILRLFGTHVKKIKKKEKYTITTTNGTLEARTIVAAAGAHSLLFAKQLGYGKEFSILPVAGNFFVSKKILNGKVYTIQNDKLPFAAIHGDPDINDPKITRFGPTAIMLPMLERGLYKSVWHFFKTSGVSGLTNMLAVLHDDTVLEYAMHNILYEIPYFGKELFLLEAKKIVPSLHDLKRAKGVGGIRPQLVSHRGLHMGDAKIIGESAIFDITPSPGATNCLQNAEEDAKRVCSFLGKRFDETGFKEEFY